MSFQAYLDNIETKTGKAPQEFVDEARSRGFGLDTKTDEMIRWLADEYGLGRGHAMALIHVIKHGAMISDTHVHSGTTHSDPSNILKLSGKDEIPPIGAPAKAALREAGITTATQLSTYSEKQLSAIHGIGPKAIRLLKQAGVPLKEDK